jgi:outer membrane protein OmpA-like peptidoglycan-associated protein
MKNFTLYLSLLLLVLLTTACQEPEPNLQEPIKKKSIKIAVQEHNKTHQKDFNKDNYVKNDAYNRVFTECFHTGSTLLNKACKIKIDSFLKSVPLNKKRVILIEVHTDKGSTNKNNLLISKKRAAKIANGLYHKEYKHSKVYYRGFGEEKPLYNSRTPQNDKENRRIVIRVKEKNEKIDRKLYSLHMVKTKKRTQKIKKHLKKVQKQKRLNIKKYTGKADTGWIYFGKEELKQKFEISCRDDKPRKVKRKSIQGHTKEEFIAGLYKKTLQAKIGEYDLRMAPISVYDNGYVAKNDPNIVLTKTNKSKKVLTTIVNTYNGEKGMLYRVFVNKKNSPKNNMECMDLVVSYETGRFEYGVAYFTDKKKLISKKLRNIASH